MAPRFVRIQDDGGLSDDLAGDLGSGSARPSFARDLARYSDLALGFPLGSPGLVPWFVRVEETSDLAGDLTGDLGGGSTRPAFGRIVANAPILGHVFGFPFGDRGIAFVRVRDESDDLAADLSMGGSGRPGFVRS